jgi:mRNA-degrading endonuclease RelE of RelBE toxin-antitoxin system
MTVPARICADSIHLRANGSSNAITRLAQGAELVGDVKRLSGSGEYRLRVGDWRVRFERHDRQLTIVVVRVLPRGRAYYR